LQNIWLPFNALKRYRLAKNHHKIVERYVVGELLQSTAIKKIPFLHILQTLQCAPMPNVMAALPNIGGALCSTPQSLADAHY